MPIYNCTPYYAKGFFRFGHFNTIYPYFLRKTQKLNFERKRVCTLDNDFFDVDCILNHKNDRALILLHGLEGSSHSQYILGMAAYFSAASFDIYAINFRSCSGEMNQQAKMYHSGFIEDLQYFINQFHQPYTSLYLAGFSLGGNVTLRYMSVHPQQVHPKVSAAVALSVPIDLKGASIEMDKWINRIYVKKFLKTLMPKVALKYKQYPHLIDIRKIQSVNNLIDFDHYFTAPLHGFVDAYDYYASCSSLPFLKNISTPTLLINAEDDSFLSETCYPYTIAQQSEQFYFHNSKYGGHVGYAHWNDTPYWYEKEILNFFNQH